MEIGMRKIITFTFEGLNLIPKEAPKNLPMPSGTEH